MMPHALHLSPPSHTGAGGASGESRESGEAALYRLLFSFAAVFYVAWWPLNHYAMLAAVDPLGERVVVSSIALVGVLSTLRRRWLRYAPAAAEVVIYAITLHYFTLVYRNGFGTTVLVGLFITLSSIGLVPRGLRNTIVYTVVVSFIAGATCRLGGADGAVWGLVFGGVSTLQTVALGVALRLHRVTAAREQAERGLVAAKDAAELAARTKNEFLAKVSHELRTPMNGVINMVKLVRDTRLTAAQHEYLETASACAEGMLSIVNDLLDLSKLEAGRMALSPTHFSLSHLLDRALKELGHRAAAKGLTLQVNVHTDVPDRLLGDELRLQQVLVNLVGNAVKFTEQGGIEVAVVATPGEGAKQRLSFWVSDTGPGIPPEKLQHIFVAFAQADGSITRRYGGTGLGLTISSEIVELMGGRLNVTSRVGVGSSFQFDALFERSSPDVALATAARDHEVGADASETPAKRLAVLLAEDNKVNERIVCALLERAGHEVVATENGQLALAALSRRAFDVVLLDVQMPVMDGHEAARRIRAGEVPGMEHVPLVAITAQAIAGDREKCFASGMNAYVPKPIDRDLLISTVERLGNRRSLRLGDAVAASAPSPKPVEVAALDVPDLMRRVGNDEALLATVLSAYLRESRVILQAIHRALAGQEGDAVRRSAHKLKGALLTLGARDAARVAASIEELGARGSWTNATETVAELEREVARVNAFIELRFASLVAPSNSAEHLS